MCFPKPLATAILGLSAFTASHGYADVLNNSATIEHTSASQYSTSAGSEAQLSTEASRNTELASGQSLDTKSESTRVTATAASDVQASTATVRSADTATISKKLAPTFEATARSATDLSSNAGAQLAGPGQVITETTDNLEGTPSVSAQDDHSDTQPGATGEASSASSAALTKHSEITGHLADDGINSMATSAAASVSQSVNEAVSANVAGAVNHSVTNTVNAAVSDSLKSAVDSNIKQAINGAF